jgi:hypothetical protein
MKKGTPVGLIKANRGILTELRNKIRENNEIDVKNSLSVEISRFSFLVATRLEKTDDVKKSIRLSASLTMLAQAQTLTSTDNREARKLFNMARRLGR